ncbi:hypothetical protein CapIbe_002675 [Capra ibex]
MFHRHVQTILSFYFPCVSMAHPRDLDFVPQRCWELAGIFFCRWPSSRCKVLGSFLSLRSCLQPQAVFFHPLEPADLPPVLGSRPSASPS